ncbi:MAG: hypothetical protein IJR59_00740 [Firmicutes bacterium]|nr:hypothetical protein [Bacillota bacterium]
MYFCRFRFFAILMICLGSGLAAGAFLTFWKAVIIGAVLIIGGLWLWFNK